MSLDSRLEFPLAQGWAKGLVCCFENTKTSADFPIHENFYLKQTHSDKIHILSPSDIKKEKPLGEGDGLIAQGDWIKESRKKLCVKTADCIPLVYVDITRESLAIIHAGWRGLQKGIHLKPFEMGYFDPLRTWIWAGPSLNGETFEVGADMYSQFQKKYQNDTEIFVPKGEKKYFYPWRLLHKDFLDLKVELLYNVEVDTFEDQDYTSYRRLKNAGKELQGTQNISWLGFVQ